MRYVGVGVHVRNSYLTVLDEAGQVLKKGRVMNERVALADWLSDLPAEPMRACLESTCKNDRVDAAVIAELARSKLKPTRSSSPYVSRRSNATLWIPRRRA